MRAFLLGWALVWAMGGAQERPIQWLQRAQQAESSLAVAGVRVTELQVGRSVRRLEERFWRQGARAERIEILAPPERRGEVLLFRGGRWVAFRPDAKEAFELPDNLPQGAPLIQKAIELTQAGVLQAELLPESTQLGRDCAVVRLSRPRLPQGRSSPPSKVPHFPASISLWIDKETGLILRYETSMHRNAPVLRMEMTRLELNPRLSPDLFTLPQGVVVRPLGGEYKSVEEAQRDVSFPIRVPSYLPTGAKLERVLVRRRPPDNAPIVILLYQTPNARFSVFQARQKGEFDPQRPGRRPDRLNMRFWRDGDYSFGIVGNLPRAEIEKIAASLSRSAL
ncbi:MAG: hypothetical protein N2554_10680 [Fimbriimonadales bacterium]|nr:hypothetical protein [Fimbriimonadales bacterium]